MKLDDLKDKKILIVGYGVEGRATEAYIKKKYPRAIIGVVDQKDGPSYLEKQLEYDIAIKSPGVKKSLLTIPYTTATNIFFANISNPIIAVTGTKGKSTTASLIHHILTVSGKKSHLIGNIGMPALELLMSPLDSNDFIVMELSSYQLEDIHYSPHFAVITSLFPEHMDYHENTNSYYKAKKNMLVYIKPHDVIFFNSKYKQVNKWMKLVNGKKVDVASLSVNSSGFQLIGKHNYENLLLAYAVSLELHIPSQIICKAFSTFKPLSHRLEKVGEYNGILFYDDAISTTPESTIAALDSLSHVDTLLLGGQDRGYDFTLLVDKIMQKNVSNLVLFPDSGNKIYALLKNKHINTLNILQTTKMEDAVNYAFKHTKKGSICLLSTASPSYSIWKNYIEKGDLFKKYIMDYEKN